METLARFRKPAPTVIAEFLEIEDTEADLPVFGTVPGSWLFGRRMGRATVLRKPCADIYRSEWLSHLRREMEPELSALAPVGKKEFDLSDLMSRNRQISQNASTRIHTAGDFRGIYYQSRHGRDLSNWALFEPFELDACGSSELSSDDPAFQKALELLDLTFDPIS